MQIIVYAVLALAVMGMIGTGVYKVKQWGGNEVRAEWNQANEKARAEEQAKSEQAAKELADAKAKRQVVYKTITQTVDKYIDRPIYKSECFDPDGLRDAQSAIAGKITDRLKSDSKLPAVKPAR